MFLPLMTTSLKLPLWLVRLLYYGVIVLAVLLIIICLPLILIYASFLCCGVMRWKGRGKDVLTVFADTPGCKERLNRLLPLLASRAEFLNWSERHQWKRWSLAEQLFRLWAFVSTPPWRLKSALPVIFVFGKLGWPKVFSFGVGTGNDAVFERVTEVLGTVAAPTKY